MKSGSEWLLDVDAEGDAGGELVIGLPLGDIREVVTDDISLFMGPAPPRLFSLLTWVLLLTSLTKSIKETHFSIEEKKISRVIKKGNTFS